MEKELSRHENFVKACKGEEIFASWDPRNISKEPY